MIKILWIVSIFVGTLFAEWNYKYDVGIMTGGIGGTYIKFGRDSMNLMHKLKNKILVRPIVSVGSQDNLMALKKSPGVDLAIVQADVMKAYKESGQLGNLINELRYITYLYNEEIHIAVKRNSSLNYFKDLNNKKVAVGSKGSGTALTSNNIVTLMGLNVQKMHLGFTESMKKLKSGEIDAVISVGGKPLSKFTPYLNDIKFLSASDDAIEVLRDSYVPASLTSEDYTTVQQTVNTVAVPSILACYNWTKRKSPKRFNGLQAFVKAFHNNLDMFKQIGLNTNNKKWQQIDFRKNVPGWKRHSIVSRYDMVGDL